MATRFSENPLRVFFQSLLCAAVLTGLFVVGCDSAGPPKEEVDEALQNLPTQKPKEDFGLELSAKTGGDTLFISVKDIARPPEKSTGESRLTFGSIIEVTDGGAEIRSDTVMSFAPPLPSEVENKIEAKITYKLKYGSATNTEELTINVAQNEQPELTSPGRQQNVEGEDVSLQIEASDPEEDPLVYSANNLPDGLAIKPTNGLIEGVIANGAAQNDPYDVTVTASDSITNPDTVKFEWVVLPDDDTPPEFSNATVSSDNGSIDIEFSEEIFGSPDGESPVELEDFRVEIQSNGGSETDVTLEGLTGISGGQINNGANSVRLQIDIVDGPASGNELIKVLPADNNSIFDAAGNAAMVTETDIEVGLNDRLAPTFMEENSDPSKGAQNVPVDATIRLAFSENIEAGTGEIVIQKSEGDPFESFDVSEGRGSEGGTVTFQRSDVEIKPDGELEGNTEYHMMVDSVAIKDESGNTFEGINRRATYFFTTEAIADTTGPRLLGDQSEPKDDATGVVVDIEPLLHFSESVQAGTGSVKIIKQGSSDVISLDVKNGAQVSFMTGDEKTVRIRPGELQDDRTYYVNINEGVFKDSSENENEEVSNSTTYNFKTEDNTPPELEDAIVDGDTLMIEYNELLDTESVPSTSDYEVDPSQSEDISINEVIVREKEIILVLNKKLKSGEDVSLDYDPGTNPVQDRSGNEASEINNKTVENKT
jgi:methionine-rich copper-binding protein CopC